MTPIADEADPRVELFRGVADADLRGRHGLFLVEGVRIVRRFLMALAAGLHEARALLLSTRCASELAAPLARNPGIPCFVAEEALLSRIAGYRLHRGALALGVRGEDPDIASLLAPPSRDACILAAERVVHVDNLGSLFRNAGSFGRCSILLDPESSDPLLRKTIRISAGRALTVPWARAQDWPGALSRLRDAGWRIVAAEATPEAIPLAGLAQGHPTVCVFGSEGDGLREETLRICDEIRMIPMAAPDAEVDAADRPSLNVAVASAVFLHELRRGRA